MHIQSQRAAYAGLALAILSTSAWAQTDASNLFASQAFSPYAPVTEVAPVVATVEPMTDDLGTSVDGDVLASMRGGEAENTQIVDIVGNVDGNTATGVVTGDNLILGGSFANSAGIATVIQNTGANVLIQNGMVVNVQFGAGP